MLIKHIAVLKFVDKEKAQQRYNICLKCEHLNNTFKTCTKCGCFILGKTKIDTTCPIGKW